MLAIVESSNSFHDSILDSIFQVCRDISTREMLHTPPTIFFLTMTSPNSAN